MLNVDSELKIVASEELKKEVQLELQLGDPTEEKSEAILKEYTKEQNGKKE